MSSPSSLRSTKSRAVPYLPLFLVVGVLGFVSYSWIARRQQDAFIHDLQRQVAALSSLGAESGRAPPPVAPSARRGQLQGAFVDDSPADLPPPQRQAMTQALSAALPPGSTVTALDCKSAMCRIETKHPDRRRYESFVRAAFVHPSVDSPLNAPTFSIPLDDTASAAGALAAVTFVARPGHTLPLVSEASMPTRL
jgi:hypothetical protein